MSPSRLHKGRTVAVIGSLAVFGGGASAVAATRSATNSHLERAAAGTSTPPGRSATKPLASLTTGELAVLAKARRAIAAAAGSIATPILDHAVLAGTITAAQRAAYLASLSATSGPGAGPDGTWTGATGASGAAESGPHATPRAGARAVFAQVQAAIEAQVSSIATPVLDAAVTDAAITSAQEATLLSLLESGPSAPVG